MELMLKIAGSDVFFKVKLLIFFWEVATFGWLGPVDWVRGYFSVVSVFVCSVLVCYSILII